MPLTTAQEDIIQSVLNPVLEFPSEFDELINEINDLKNMFRSSSEPNASHNYFYLYKTLSNPTECFNKLENMNVNSISVGEVQEYILQLMDQSLTQAAKKTNAIDCLKDWDLNFLRYKFINNKNYHTIFKSQNVPVDSGTHPWALPELRNKIFTATLRIERNDEQEEDFFNFTVNELYVDVVINGVGDSPTIRSGFFYILPTFFLNDWEETLYIEGLKPYAVQTAEEIAADVALAYLEEKGILSLNFNRDYLNALITTDYYYHLLATRTLTQSLLEQLSSAHVAILVDPFILELIKNNILTLENAINLNDIQRLLLSHPTYHSLFKQKKINIDELSEIDIERYKFLVCPAIANLIQQNKLNFTIAKFLPLTIKDLVINPFLETYFFTKEIPWERFLLFDAEESQLFQDKKLASLITDQIINPKSLPRITKNMIALLNIALIEKLLRNKLVEVDVMLSEESTTILFYVLEFPIIYAWLESGMITWGRLKEIGIIECCCECLSNRIYSFYSATPYCIQNKTDEMDMITNDLLELARIFNLHYEHLKAKVLTNFLNKLNRDISIVTQYESGFLQKKFKPFLISLREHYKKNSNPEIIISDLVRLAKMQLTKIKNKKHFYKTNFIKSYTGHFAKFFPSTNNIDTLQDRNHLEFFCKRILKLADIIRPTAMDFEPYRQKLGS